MSEKLKGLKGFVVNSKIYSGMHNNHEVEKLIESLKYCHSERSEESLSSQPLVFMVVYRSFASLKMTY
jgi:hypothetical protein